MGQQGLGLGYVGCLLIYLMFVVATGQEVWFFVVFFWFVVTPEGFTTVVANEGLEKARLYLTHCQDRRLYIPSEGCGVNFRWKHLQTTPTHFFGQS